MKLPRSSSVRWKATLVLCLLILGAGVVSSTRRASAPAREASVPEPVAPAIVAAAPASDGAVAPKSASAPVERRVTPPPAMVAGAVPASAPAQGGLIVAIDPETGQLGPASPAQVRELLGPALETSRTEENLVQIHHPNGAVGVQLDERYHEYMFVRMAPNGKKTYSCVHADGYRHDVVADVVPATPAPALEVE